MSRALEKDVAASLKKNLAAGDAFQAISAALLPPTIDELLEVEILPRSHQLSPGTHLLSDGHAIAVSKVSLVQAFLVATHVLKAHLDLNHDQDPSAGENGNGNDSTKLLAATAVMLLMDPEHLTAANTRKRLLQARVVVSSADDMRLYFEREKHLVDSLLTSRLHRHTKSPTLWSHRRWLTALAVSSPPLGAAVRAADQQAWLLSEIASVVAVSGERHPRNYCAWAHARWLVGIAEEASSSGKDDDEHEHEDQQVRLVDFVKDWCVRHHTDISGWSFLHFLLVTLRRRRRRRRRGTGTARRVYGEVLQLASALQWTNESVWVFLRTVVASGLVGDDDGGDGAYTEFRDACRGLLAALKDGAQSKVLEASMAWCETYRVQR